MEVDITTAPPLLDLYLRSSAKHARISKEEQEENKIPVENSSYKTTMQLNHSTPSLLVAKPSLSKKKNFVNLSSVLSCEAGNRQS